MLPGLAYSLVRFLMRRRAAVNATGLDQHMRDEGYERLTLTVTV
jgi:hypothetical protein